MASRPSKASDSPGTWDFQTIDEVGACSSRLPFQRVIVVDIDSGWQWSAKSRLVLVNYSNSARDLKNSGPSRRPGPVDY